MSNSLCKNICKIIGHDFGPIRNRKSHCERCKIKSPYATVGNWSWSWKPKIKYADICVRKYDLFNRAKIAS